MAARLQPVTFQLENEDRTLRVARCFAESFQASGLSFARIHLSGNLGAGKTTFARGFIQSFGHSGNVKSPTYTLIEPYYLPDITIHHLDLYRLGDAQELDYLGIDDVVCQGQGICLIEWPERGAGGLPAPTLSLELKHLGQASQADNGREMVARAHSAQAQGWLKRSRSHFEGDPQIKD